MDYGPIEGVDWLPNHYAVLGIEKDSTPKQISRAYRTQIKGIHPDDLNRADEMMDQVAAFLREPIQHAYEVLKDPEQKAAYDTLLDEFFETKPQCVSDTGRRISVPVLRIHTDALIANQTLDTSPFIGDLLKQTGYNETIFATVEAAYKADPENPALKNAYRNVLLQKDEYLEVLEEVAWVEAGVSNSETLPRFWNGTSQSYKATIDEFIAQTRDTIAGTVEHRVKALTAGVAPKLLTAEGDVYEPQNVQDEVALRKTLTDAALTTYDENVEFVRNVAAEHGVVMEQIVALADWEYYPKDQPLTDRLLVVVAMNGLIDSAKLYDSSQGIDTDPSNFVGLSVEDFKKSSDIDMLRSNGITTSLLSGTQRFSNFESEYVVKRHREKLQKVKEPS